jgi:hypothetical protein
MKDDDHRDGYDRARLEEWDIQSLKALRTRVTKELDRRGRVDIQRLEAEANEIRAVIGLKQRPPLRNERPVKA